MISCDGLNLGQLNAEETRSPPRRQMINTYPAVRGREY